MTDNNTRLLYAYKRTHTRTQHRLSSAVCVCSTYLEDGMGVTPLLLLYDLVILFIVLSPTSRMLLKRTTIAVLLYR